MNYKVNFEAFKRLVKDVSQIYSASELGAEAIKAEDSSAALHLRQEDNVLYAEASTKGLEIHGSIPVEASVEAGRVAIKLASLQRLGGKEEFVSLSLDGNSLHIDAGTFSAQIPAVANAKMSTYEEVPLTHAVDAKLLRVALKGAALTDVMDGHPDVKLRWDADGLRCWAHNVFYAAHTICCDKAAALIEFNCCAPLAEAVASTATTLDPNVQFGCDGRSYRFKTAAIDLTCPIKARELEDLDKLVKAIQLDAYPSFTVEAKVLNEALDAVGSVDIQEANAKQMCLDLTCIAPKNIVLLVIKTKLGYTKQQFAVSDIKNIDVEHFAVVNMRALASFVARLKGRDLVVSMLPDRLVLSSGPFTYVVTLVRD